MYDFLIQGGDYGETNTVRVLLEHGVDPNIQEFFGSRDGTPLLWAAERSRQETIRCLLDHGANVNYQSKKYGDVAIIYAVEENDVPIIKAELDKGADINLPNSFGNTPVIQAAREGEIESLRLLLQRHPDMQHRNKDGETALSLIQESIASVKRGLAAKPRDTYAQNALARLNITRQMLIEAGAKP